MSRKRLEWGEGRRTLKLGSEDCAAGDLRPVPAGGVRAVGRHRGQQREGEAGWGEQSSELQVSARAGLWAAMEALGEGAVVREFLLELMVREGAMAQRRECRSWGSAGVGGSGRDGGGGMWCTAVWCRSFAGVGRRSGPREW